MRYQFLIALFLIPIYLSAQDEKTIIKRFFYRDSVLAGKSWYGDGKKTDSLKTYYKTGELDEAFYFSNGKFNGTSYKFNKEGKKVTSWQYENGTLIKRTDHILEFNKKDEVKIKVAHQKLKELNTNLKANPNDLKSRLARAHLRQSLGNYTLALFDYSIVEKNILKFSEAKKTEAPKKLLANIYDAKASIYSYYEMDNYTIHYKLKAIKADPKNNRLIYNLGSYLYTIKSYRLAKIYLDSVLKKEPNHPFVHRLLAAYYTDFEDYEKAKHHIDMAFPNEQDLIKHGSGKLEHDFRTIRGFIWHNLGDSKKGIDDLKEAIDMDKDNSFAHRNLGVIYYDLGEYNLACEYLQKAKSLGYEKTHDRDNLQAYLELSCENTTAQKQTVALEQEHAKLVRLADKPFVYPNPTVGDLNIKNFEYDNFDYLVFDYTGKLVKQGVSIDKSLTISNLPSGVYILKIIKDDIKKTFRVVKQ